MQSLYALQLPAPRGPAVTGRERPAEAAHSSLARRDYGGISLRPQKEQEVASCSAESGPRTCADQLSPTEPVAKLLFLVHWDLAKSAPRTSSEFHRTRVLKIAVRSCTCFWLGT